MPQGYELRYAANVDTPFWHYGIGQSPDVKNPAGTIAKGGQLYLQRPPDAFDKLGTHRSAFLEGVGRVIVRLEDFGPVEGTHD